MTPQYNAFEHLRQSLFLAFDDLMSMLTIYCDESGTDRKNRVAAVGGYIGQVVQWQRFEREWSKILNKPCYGVAMLHRSDLETWHGEFTEKRGWNPNRRGALLNELHRIIKLRTKVAIGSAVIKEDWESVMPNWVKKSFGGV